MRGDLRVVKLRNSLPDSDGKVAIAVAVNTVKVVVVRGTRAETGSP